MQPRTETASQCQPCGNPNAVAELRQGEKMLDLGSGGGIDVLPSARESKSRVRLGVDMADEMLDLDRAKLPRPAPPTSSSSRAPSRTSRYRMNR
jgi:2-polyprenyl-3-methyl-5-hydroxy-6-metoxy-1,4-benzoquinol methylase